HHAVIGMALAVSADDPAAEVGGPASGYRDEPPFGNVSLIHLDFANGALELGERRHLAVAALHDLDFARVDELGERVRSEIVRVVARVAQDQFVELAGLEAE